MILSDFNNYNLFRFLIISSQAAVKNLKNLISEALSLDLKEGCRFTWTHVFNLFSGYIPFNFLLQN